MILVKHDFYHNFTAAADSFDYELLFQIFSSECADLLFNQSQQVFDLFSKSGIRYNPNVPYCVYVDIFVKNIKAGNQQFVQGLGFLLGQNNNSFTDQWQEQLGDVTGAINSIGQDINDNPADEKLLKSKMLDAIQVRINRSGGDTRPLYFKSSMTFALIYIVALAGMLIYAFGRNKATPVTLGAKPAKDPAFNVSEDVLVPAQTPPSPSPTATEGVQAAQQTSPPIPPATPQPQAAQNPPPIPPAVTELQKPQI